jgi:hypothetical protein
MTLAVILGGGAVGGNRAIGDGHPGRRGDGACGQGGVPT